MVKRERVVLATTKTSFIRCFISFLFCILLLKKESKCVRVVHDESNRCRDWPLVKRSSYYSVFFSYVKKYNGKMKAESI